MNTSFHAVDKLYMKDPAGKYSAPKKQQCAYKMVCYIAEAMDCFGYRLDCPLYRKSNGEFLTETAFHRAVDNLIDKTKAGHQGLL